MFTEKRLCPKCKTGFEQYILDKSSPECPFIASNTGCFCPFFIELTGWELRKINYQNIR